jgi:hypothetical protein
LVTWPEEKSKKKKPEQPDTSPCSGRHSSMIVGYHLRIDSRRIGNEKVGDKPGEVPEKAGEPTKPFFFRSPFLIFFLFFFKLVEIKKGEGKIGREVF